MFQWVNQAIVYARRRLTGYPSSITPEIERAWLREEVRAYATLQPFASPLTTPDGGFSAGETWEMRRGYREMAMREPAVKAALLTKCMAVASLDPQVMASNKRSPEDKAAARWVDHSIRCSEGGWPGLIMDMLLPSLIDGWSVLEPVWMKVDPLAEEYAGYWSIAQAKSKDTEFIRFRLDQYRNVMALQAMNAGQGGRPFDPRDFIIFTHLSFFCNPFGLSDLRAANRAANLIEAAIKLRAILLENFSGPYLIAKAKDPTVQQKLKLILGNARARGYVVVPDDTEIEVINLATSAPDQFQSTISDLREEIVMAIQGAYLQLLEGGVSNGRGNTEVHKGVSELFQWWLAAQICNRLNKSLVPDLVRPNFGRRVGLPTIQLGGIDPAAVNTALQRFVTLQGMGLPLSRDQVYEEGNAEPPRDVSDELKPPANAGQPGAPGGPGGSPKPLAAPANPFDLSADTSKGGGEPQQFADTFPAGHVFSLVDPEVLGRSSKSIG